MLVASAETVHHRHNERVDRGPVTLRVTRRKHRRPDKLEELAHGQRAFRARDIDRWDQDQHGLRPGGTPPVLLTVTSKDPSAPSAAETVGTAVTLCENPMKPMPSPKAHLAKFVGPQAQRMHAP